MGVWIDGSCLDGERGVPKISAGFCMSYILLLDLAHWLFDVCIVKSIGKCIDDKHNHDYF